MKKTLISDILAGLTVSFAALSLGAAFGVMSQRGAFAGMLGAAIIPIVTSIFGGTRIQASGPTAPMTAITALIVGQAYDQFSDNQQLADQYITMVLLMASIFIILAGLLRLGKFISYVPQVVVLGFMNGIGVLIWFDQIKKMFGLAGQKALNGDLLLNLGIALSTLGMILTLPIILRKLKVPAHIRRFVPAIFVTIIFMTAITSIFQIGIEHVSLGESYSSFGEFWNVVKSNFPLSAELYDSQMLLQATPLALQLCLLAYLDSLLTSLVIDKMTKEKTNANKELMAQGLGNGLAGLFQGIPGAQATIRSVLLIKEGAQTRLAGILVGVFALLGFLVFANWIALIASAVFVGVLFKAGLDVLDRDFPVAYIKNKWYKNKERNIQAFLVVLTTLITVLIDLNVAVFVGTALFYILQYSIKLSDAEDDFSEVHSEELFGTEVEEFSEELSI